MAAASVHGASPTTTGRPATRLAVGTAYFLLFLGPGVALPYLPRWLDHLGMSDWQIGIAVGLQPLLRWTSALAFAHVADRRRIRHRLSVLCAAAGGLLVLPLLFVRSFPAVVAVLVGINVFQGPLVSALDACVLDHLPALGGDYGRLRLWGSISFIAGTLVGAAALAWSSPAIVPFLLLPPALLLPLAFAPLPATQAGHGDVAGAPWRLVTPRLATFLTAALLLNVSSGAWIGFFAIHTEHLGLGDWAPGVAFALAVAVEVALFHWGRALVDRLAPERLIVVVILVTVARWLGTAVADAAWLVVGLQIGHAVTFSCFHLAAMHLMPRLVPPERSTSGQALYGITGLGLGGSIGIALAGALAEPLGTRALFGFEAVVAALALPAALRLARVARR